jgi:4-hydroxythreonine-4-phosphate dehydrogenase
VLKSAAESAVRSCCAPVIIGNARCLQQVAKLLGLPLDYTVVKEPSGLKTQVDEPVVFDIGGRIENMQLGRLSAAAGHQAINAIECAVQLCQTGFLDAMATAPVNKEALKLAGSRYHGHTEMLADLCGVSRPIMCFFAGNLKVFLLTIHTSLLQAIAAVTRAHVVDSLLVANAELKRFGIRRPRIAVAGLNPHAGEHGLFGSEEKSQIEPAIAECRAQHDMDVSGPFPADTVFLRAYRGEFDAVAACYHDQGLIAVKCLAFGEAVNVTLGLPIIRTSVDHGTAFDIAGQGTANHQSMVEAIKLAARLVLQQRRAVAEKETSGQ